MSVGFNIYLAGKVTKNGWREDFFEPQARDVASDFFYRYTNENYTEAEMIAEGFPVIEKSILGIHNYVGPYAMACDHGCYHAPSEDFYDTGDDGNDEEIPVLRSDYAHGLQSMSPCTFENGIPKNVIHKLCLNAVAKCDVLFAWIDSPDCYGTISEIAYAKALGKKIIIGGKIEISFDMWFVYQMADVLHIKKNATPITSFKFSIGPVFHRHYIKSSEWKSKADEAKKMAGYRCQICNSSGQLDAHHRTYERIGNENLSDITVLCRSCHELYESNKKIQIKKVQL